MILTVNIGNSYISIGGYEGKNLIFTAETVSDARKTKDQYSVEIRNMMELYNVDANATTGAIIASVVPELTSALSGAIEKMCGVTPMIVGPGVKSGLNIRIENPAQLGADICAAAVAAAERYPEPCIVCILGTATVMGVLLPGKIFGGVIIAAGVDTTLDGFTKRTALLPHVDITAPKHLIGKNTVQSVQSGLVFGTAAMIDGLAMRIEEDIGTFARVIATGRMCDKIIPHCRRDIEVDKNLISEGLRIIYEKNSST